MEAPSEEEARENEIVSGVLLLTVNGVIRRVPELKWRANRAWQDRLREAMVALAEVPADTPDGLRAMGDAERDLVLAYDTTGVLGELDDATEREIDAIYNRLLEVSFPLAQSQTALMVALVRDIARSVPESSTNGLSVIGDSADPTSSKAASPIARSSSSTRGRRSVSSPSSASA